MGTRTIDPVDTIWLNMDRSDNLMVIESLMTLDGPVDWARFLVVLERRVLDRFPVFRQRPVDSRVPLATPHLEYDPHYSLDRHVHRATLPAPGDDVALQDYVNTFLSTPLDRDRPLWEVHLVDGYGDGSAIYTRLHHALADGIALTRVLLSMSDATADEDLVEDVADAVADPRGWGRQAAGRVVGTLLELPHLATPGRAVDALTTVGHTTAQTVAVAGKLLLTRNPASPVAGRVGPGKRAVWAQPFPLDAVVRTGHATGTTVNDVLVAALAGALSAYLRDHHGDVVDVPTMIPVNVRSLDDPLPRELGNKFALVLFLLPSGLDTPFARLAETKRRMDAIKHSPEAVLTFGMIRGIGRTGREVERVLVDFFANKATGVTTNVPGPRGPRYVAGRRVTALLGWAPESGDQALGTCIFTYDGRVHVGFKVDVGVIPDPEELVAGFTAELEALCRLGAPDQPEPITLRGVES
jgi:WS/DGAT/MGAT family acyltransferase